MARFPHYSIEESRSRPWLQALFIIASLLAGLPLALGLLGLGYALYIATDDTRDVLRLGVLVAGGAGGLLVGGSIVWLLGLRWLYRKAMPPENLKGQQ